MPSMMLTSSHLHGNTQLNRMRARVVVSRHVHALVIDFDESLSFHDGPSHSAFRVAWIDGGKTADSGILR
eukprot:2576844-Amphidinium_carterae.1